MGEVSGSYSSGIHFTEDSRRSPECVHFLRIWFKKHSCVLALPVCLCKPLYPSISFLCSQESSDAILEWQRLLQPWLRSAELILVPREEGEKSHPERQEGLLVPGLGAAWCNQTHHISPLEPLFVCLHNTCLPRSQDKESMKVAFCDRALL